MFERRSTTDSTQLHRAIQNRLETSNRSIMAKVLHKELVYQFPKLQKRELNRALYALQTKGVVEQRADYSWMSKKVPSAPVTTPAKPSPASKLVIDDPGLHAPQLTPEQKSIVEFEASGHLLIRGEAGSGKTTVLAARAKNVAQADLISSGSMLFLTYNVALAEYVKLLLAAQGSNASITVTTFHTWARNMHEKLTGKPGRFTGGQSGSKRNLLLDQALQENQQGKDNHLFGQHEHFWLEEISWIYGQGIATKEQYASCTRTGRGTAVQVRGDDRALVWSVFSAYDQLVKKGGNFDYDDAAGMVLRAVDSAGGVINDSQRFDHVFIDEVQDFSLSWLVVLTPIARRSLTLAGDLAQRIYRRSFSWRAAGISVSGGRSRALKGSHRTTREIMEVAIPLAKNSDLASDPDYQVPTKPVRSGPKVRRIQRSHWNDAQEDAVAEALRMSRQNPSSTVVIAAQFGKTATKIARQCNDAGIKAAVSKGSDLAMKRNGLIVTTYHQLKGLEFDHVVLIGLEDETMPKFWLQKKDESETEAEAENFLRRLIYVALTRARNSVLISGGKPFSRFFDEVPGHAIEEI
jgi:superfamily I DNA/RNA helicase